MFDATGQVRIVKGISERHGPFCTSVPMPRPAAHLLPKWWRFGLLRCFGSLSIGPTQGTMRKNGKGTKRKGPERSQGASGHSREIALKLPRDYSTEIRRRASELGYKT